FRQSKTWRHVVGAGVATVDAELVRLVEVQRTRDGAVHQCREAGRQLLTGNPDRALGLAARQCAQPPRRMRDRIVGAADGACDRIEDRKLSTLDGLLRYSIEFRIEDVID